MKPNISPLNQQLESLKLPFLQKNYAQLAQESAQQKWDHVEYLQRLIEGEYIERREKIGRAHV